MNIQQTMEAAIAAMNAGNEMLLVQQQEIARLESENRRLLQLLTDIKDNAEIAAVSFSERLP